jgi:hypothetical protein
VAQYRGSAAKTVLQLRLVAHAAAPVAVLSAPGGEVTPDMVLLLDASSSWDPEEPEGAEALAASWACWRADTLAPCFATVGDARPGCKPLPNTQLRPPPPPPTPLHPTPPSPTHLQAKRGNQGALYWELPAALLPQDKWVVVQLTVSKGAGATYRTDTARTTLRLRPAAAKSSAGLPRGFIARGSPGPHSSNEPLTLTAVLANGSETADVAWSSPSINLQGYFNDVQLGELDLTVPALLLPHNAAWVTFYADLTQGSLTTR